MRINFLQRRVEVHGQHQQFRLYVPPDYSDDRAWPAILFLHGAGERGSDSVAPTKVGIGPHLRSRQSSFPAIVLFPQCSHEAYWSAPEARAVASAALEQTTSEFHIDSARVALTGISMGAAGAWLMASEQPERFASLVPVCGWVSARAKSDLAAFAGRLAHIPIWIFHGDADNIVRVDESRTIYTALQAAGVNVHYSELRGVAHNSWDPAYGESGVMEWMVSAGVRR